jgi:hypothetical protein
MFTHMNQNAKTTHFVFHMTVKEGGDPRAETCTVNTARVGAGGGNACDGLTAGATTAASDASSARSVKGAKPVKAAKDGRALKARHHAVGRPLRTRAVAPRMRAPRFARVHVHR